LSFQAEREKTKGSNWFNMKAPEVTSELKNEIQVVQMRSALDPKHFYKRNEMKTVPKYFEVRKAKKVVKAFYINNKMYLKMGQVMDSPVDYHSSKNIRKAKKTLVDELLENADFQRYNKRKYQESTEIVAKSGYNKAMKKMRKLKKKSK
jgi:Fcf2 pre-rRNA processing